jgi:hypothetical protein
MISSVSCVSSSTPASLRSDDPTGRLPAGAAGREANLIRVLEATVKGPRRGSQHPAYQRPPVTKDIRRQRATSPIFIRERAPPQGGTKAYQQNAGNRCAKDAPLNKVDTEVWVS